MAVVFERLDVLLAGKSFEPLISVGSEITEVWHDVGGAVASLY